MLLTEGLETSKMYIIRTAAYEKFSFSGLLIHSQSVLGSEEEAVSFENLSDLN